MQYNPKSYNMRYIQPEIVDSRAKRAGRKINETMTKAADKVGYAVGTSARAVKDFITGVCGK